MTTALHLPQADDLGKFLAHLFGLKVSADDASTVSSDEIYALATYVDDEGVVRGVIACDLKAAAKFGAALTQIPTGAVEDAIDADTLPDNLAENLCEVFNIAVNLFPESNAHRLAVGIVETGANASERFAIEMQGAEVNHTKVDIQRYGHGNVVIVTK